MRAVIQRVTNASVEVEKEIVGAIGRGILVLVGIGKDDTEQDLDWIITRIKGIRLWTNEQTGKAWDLNVTDINGEILSVSQFTLMGRLKGNKPDYSKAMPPAQASEMYALFLKKLRAAVGEARVKDGRFGAMMNVQLTNDGPVTFTIDSQDKSNIV